MKAVLTPDVSAPGRARAYVEAQLETTPLPAGVRLDSVVLTASELVTNAVQAGAAAVEINVQVTEQRLDLVVTDDADGWPTPTGAGPDDTAGRGLVIVDQLSDAWDVAERPRGKTVTASWFDESGRRTD